MRLATSHNTARCLPVPTPSNHITAVRIPGRSVRFPSEFPDTPDTRQPCEYQHYLTTKITLRPERFFHSEASRIVAEHLVAEFRTEPLSKQLRTQLRERIWANLVGAIMDLVNQHADLHN